MRRRLFGGDRDRRLSVQAQKEATDKARSDKVTWKLRFVCSMWGHEQTRAGCFFEVHTACVRSKQGPEEKAEKEAREGSTTPRVRPGWMTGVRQGGSTPTASSGGAQTFWRVDRCACSVRGVS